MHTNMRNHSILDISIIIFLFSQASLDDPTQTVVMHRSEPSRLQSLALQLTDKVNNFVDSNERIFEMKQGNFFIRGGNQVSKVHVHPETLLRMVDRLVICRLELSMNGVIGKKLGCQKLQRVRKKFLLVINFNECVVD